MSTTTIIRDIPFTITDCDGEYFFTAPTALHPQTLKAVIRKSMFREQDIAWFSPKHGNFSVKGDYAEFSVNYYKCDTVDEQLDLFFAGEEETA